MPDQSTQIFEQAAARAFDNQSIVFDELYGRDKIIAYKRTRVRDHVLKLLKNESSILELNAGTGEDAIFFASKGHTVLATDIAPGMLEQLTKKAIISPNGHRVQSALCSYLDLSEIKDRGPFDAVFSNFAGLNCTPDLASVLSQMPALVKPGGTITLVVMPGFCLWELLLIFKGKFRTAFRRLGKKSVVTAAHIMGNQFGCWYYSPSFIKKQLIPDFEVVECEGLCTIVPPSYIENFADKYPRLFRWATNLENRYSRFWPWRSIGDYFIISLRRCM